MANKSAFAYVGYAVLLASNLAWAECEVKSTVRTETGIENVNLGENTTYDFIEFENKKRACKATIDINYMGQAITATEEAVMQPGKEILQACEVARAQAVEELVKQIGKVEISAVSEVNCDESNQKLFSPKVGEVGQLKQFKRDQKYSGTFEHQGTQCIWFNDVEWQGELHQANGIACQMSGDNYVVVDKF